MSMDSASVSVQNTRLAYHNHENAYMYEFRAPWDGQQTWYFMEALGNGFSFFFELKMLRLF
jgi:hypothetical protein